MISELACKKWQAFIGFAPFAAIHPISNELQSRSFKIDGVTKRSLTAGTVEDDIPYPQSALTLLSAASLFSRFLPIGLIVPAKFGEPVLPTSCSRRIPGSLYQVTSPSIGFGRSAVRPFCEGEQSRFPRLRVPCDRRDRSDSLLLLYAVFIPWVAALSSRRSVCS